MVRLRAVQLARKLTDHPQLEGWTWDGMEGADHIVTDPAGQTWAVDLVLEKISRKTSSPELSGR